MSPRVSKQHLEERKNHILDAAKRVFERKGYEPVTMQDIVKEAGISRGNLYQYFSNTEEIMQAVIEKNDDSFYTYIQDLASSHEKVWDAIQAYQKVVFQSLPNPYGIVMYEYSVTRWRNPERKAFFPKKVYPSHEKLFSASRRGRKTG
ncbi:UNVERIFIED_ORG: AcrR family transcriptional regulator [Heyndrickxia coagulans]